MNLFDLAPKRDTKQTPEEKSKGVFGLASLAPPRDIFSEESETERIIKIPVHSEYTTDLSWIYSKTPSIELREIQYRSLQAIAECKGLLGLIPVGHGKTLIAYLSGLVLGSKNAVIMMPPNMVESFKKEIEKYKSSFLPVPKYTILPYSILSSPKSSDILSSINPDLIVADEAHCLASKNSSRALRFRRYMKEHPETHFVAMSGTFLKKSILDLAPLSFYALRHLSPFPNDKDHAAVWAECLDVTGRASTTQWDFFNTFTKTQGIDLTGLVGQVRQEMAREAVYRRLVTTAGIVTTTLASVDVSLTIEEIKIPTPDIILEALKIVEDGETPDHEDIIVDEVHKNRVVKSLSSGFYYRWAWEKIGGRDEDWLLRRKIWSRELRRELLYHNTTHYDSPLLITNVVRQDEDHPMHNTWLQWSAVRHKPTPPTEPIWLSEFLLDNLLAQLNSVPTIVWYSSSAMEDRLRKIMPVFGAGTLPPDETITCAMSIEVHGTGKNLQRWHRNIILEAPSSAVKWEQLLGRTHRAGQFKDVHVLVYTHTDYLEDTIKKVKEQARFIYSVQKSPQKVLTAKWITQTHI